MYCMNDKFVVGVDEVGRGPVAGPVYVCSAKIAIQDIDEILKGTTLPLRDSKKLTERMRNKWFEYLDGLRKQGKFDYKISSAKSHEIDKSGIAVCISECVTDSLSRLISSEDRKDTLVLLDGGLKAPVAYAQQTIIKGDENEASIAFASVMAKVLRDTYMKELHSEFPHYGFDAHKGYGTAKHMDAIRTHGPCEQHRLSFLRSVL